MTWLAIGAWSAVAMTCATMVNSNPFRGEGVEMELRHFDPFQLMPHKTRRKEEPQVTVRVGQLKHLFVPGEGES